MSSTAPISLSDAYRLTVDDVATRLSADLHRGLSQQEVEQRLREVGPNELAEVAPTPAWRRFLAQFTDLLVVLLLLAAGVSTVLWLLEHESPLPYEAIAIFGVVLLNAVLGFSQEVRAEAAVASLRAMTSHQSTVLRDGKLTTIPASALVPGDVMVLAEGDAIQADGRVVESAALQAAEAALTGESLPVAKVTAPLIEDLPLGDQVNMVFCGAAVTYGHGRAVVTATGMSTELGRIAGMLSTADAESTPLQKELHRVGRILSIVVALIAVILIATIVVFEEVRGLSAWFDVLILAVALAVAAVPEGLPAVVTAVLAIGVQQMARRKAIVRRLSAVEALGSADVIATDKTGTLTKNEMTVRTIVTASGSADFSGSGYDPAGDIRLRVADGDDKELRAELTQALSVAERASNAELQDVDGRWTVQGDPTEGALIVAARKAGLRSDELERRLKRLDEAPFSSERKLMSTIHLDSDDDRCLIFTKGAPDILLSRCTQELRGQQSRQLTDERLAAIVEVNDGLAEQALRTLGVAFRPLTIDERGRAADVAALERELTFIGLVGMIDPPRVEAKDAVARARKAGIRPLMITGDHPITAAVIATELNISHDGRTMTGTELENVPDESLRRMVEEISVYARVDPKHKLRLVTALQANQRIVAMTGDGVNDAPALKAADIGVAMGVTGTDVSKEAADVVLTDDNFATIVAAVEEGRAIFDNIRKFLRYLLSSNMGEVMTMFLGLLFAKSLGLDSQNGVIVLPLLATQILWLNLVTDGPPALALGIDPAEPGLMARPPRPTGEGVLTPRMWGGILIVGVVMAVGTLYVLDASLKGGMIDSDGDLRFAQTMAFTTLMLFQLFNVFNARSDDRSAFAGLFKNGWLWAAVALSLALQLAVVYVPFLQNAFSTVSLEGKDWLFCAVVASSVMWVREATKVVARRWYKRKNDLRSARLPDWHPIRSGAER